MRSIFNCDNFRLPSFGFNEIFEFQAFFVGNTGVLGAVDDGDRTGDAQGLLGQIPHVLRGDNNETRKNIVSCQDYQIQILQHVFGDREAAPEGVNIAELARLYGVLLLAG